MDYNQIVAANIRRIRRKKKLSQETVAYDSGLSPQHLSKIERCASSPRVDTIVRIAEALDVSPAEFFNSADIESLVYIYTDID